METSLEPGALIGHKYRLERLLGRGGMGEVWAAKQDITLQRVALKLLTGEDRDKETTRKRFVREARAACAVQHPNVVQVHDVIETDDGTPVLVMELLEGETLQAKLDRDGKLTVEETVAIILRVVSAVGTAHALGVVHRDLKPDNIFLVETPDGTDVKVVDFGIAKIQSPESSGQTAALTSTNAMLGTPYYMSPEQAFGERAIDHRTDIWSLGIVMYRCLTGELPTMADNFGQILKIIMTRSIPKLASRAPQVPRALAQLVDAMLAYEAEDRPKDLRDVKAVLEQVSSVGADDDFGPPSNTLAATSQPHVAALDASPAARKGTLGPKLALGFALSFAVATGAVLVGRRQRAPVSEPTTTPAAMSTPDAVVAAAVPVSAPITAAIVQSPPPPAAATTSSQASTVPKERMVSRPAQSPQQPSTAAATTAAPTSSLGGIVTNPSF
jgi:eukaryotic-like serine/threonine-protein kinase